MGLKIALFGQAPFGRDVAIRLADAGHEIVGVHVPPDGFPGSGRRDVLAQEADERGWPLFRYKGYRRRGEVRPERLDEYLGLGAELNVLPFTTVLLPVEMVDAPRLGSLCFHPSLLPAYRGGNALAWQIIMGERESGVTVFRPDDGVDTGPIVLQQGGVPIHDTDNTASLYFDRLYPLGVDAMEQAVAAVEAGRAEFRVQDEAGASFQGLVDDAVARIDWGHEAVVVDRLIRGCDPQPGALASVGDTPVRLFGSKLEASGHAEPPGTILEVDAASEGLLVAAEGGSALRIAKLRLGEGKKAPAAQAGLKVGDRFV